VTGEKKTREVGGENTMPTYSLLITHYSALSTQHSLLCLSSLFIRQQFEELVKKAITLIGVIGVL
jgi:hypothetical protein